MKTFTIEWREYKNSFSFYVKAKQTIVLIWELSQPVDCIVAYREEKTLFFFKKKLSYLKKQARFNIKPYRDVKESDILDHAPVVVSIQKVVSEMVGRIQVAHQRSVLSVRSQQNSTSSCRTLFRRLKHGS